jgi:putative sugar O-methyltransferase
MPSAIRSISPRTALATRIVDLVEARDARVAGGHRLAAASRYWADFIANLTYVFEFSDRSLDQIRHHTYHLTSDIYLRYVLSGGADAIRLLDKYEELASAIGSKALAEPSSGIGYHHSDGLVSWDLLRYLSVLRDLLDAGVLSRNRPTAILEIGGGYGGLSRIVAMFNSHVHYTILDLEEILFFSKSYLDRTLPNFDVRLVSDVSEFETRDGRINLVPQHLTEDLAGKFDLAINHQSMQEMQPAQIERYLGLIARTCSSLYSRNLRHHDAALALRKGLSLDVAGQILSRLPRIIWKQVPARGDTVIDENLLRLVVDARDHSKTLALAEDPVVFPIEWSHTIIEQPLQANGLLEGHALAVGSSFSVNVLVPAAALALSFVTWGKTLPRFRFAVVVRDATRSISRRSESIRFDFCDWEEIIVDLREVGHSPGAAVEFTVLDVDLEGGVGIPLFSSRTPAICRLDTGRAESDRLVPAGRVLMGR